MGKYIKRFNTHTEYGAFTATTAFIKPNVSYCAEENELHYNSIETRLMVTYNVVDASQSTQLYSNGINDTFDKVEIDGIEVSITDLDNNYGVYQLSSGEHIVAYTLKDATSIVKCVF